MDEQPTDSGPQGSLTTRRRGRRLVTALAVAGTLAAIPAGAALAGGSDSSATGDGDSAGDCPEKDGQQRQESLEI